ncbi:sensor histidine kinase [Konateibacter massiliensis]|uniref:sensor histidine kinase n=1 Tax=Konateibacter massiliensis TaxID=2002841 RepID=UPI000C1532A6|nr:sensor histidine kinase [Konateibacter massiliensis]
MRDSKEDYIKNSEFKFFDELNSFVIKLYGELMTERDSCIIKQERNMESLLELKSNMLLLEDDLSCNENIFHPNYSLEEVNLKLRYLHEEEKKITKQNEELSEKIRSLDNRIGEIDHIINNMKNKNCGGYLKNCGANEDYKIEILRSQEFERKRIARDIHDSVVQKLTNMIHKSEFIMKIMDQDITRAKLELMSMSNNIRSTIEEMRNIIYNLRPMALDDIGIDVIIERELLKIKENGINVTYDVLGDNSNVDQIVQITLIRIIQEACNNAVKHSDFTEFCVKIVYNQDCVEVYIKDNGKGFEVLKTNDMVYESKSGFGLSMMRERVYLLSGLINFETGEDKGTQIYVKVPKCFREDK